MACPLLNFGRAGNPAGNPAGIPGGIPAAIASLALLAACGSGKGEADGDGVGIGDGDGEIADARFLSDVFTWTCQENDGGATFQGVFGQVISLEYAPGAIDAHTLPDPGACAAGVDMFPRSAGDGALDLPGVSGDPGWVGGGEDGVLQKAGRGFYRDDVFPGVRSCLNITEVLGAGTELIEAGALTGAITPEPVEVPVVEYAGLSTDGGLEVIRFGDEITVSWGDHAWDEVWVQIAREREGVAWESATCNGTGATEIELGDAAWGLLDPDLEVEQNSLYVGFQRSDRVTAEDGSSVQTVTRAVAVALVQD